jgi:1-deoxy-D-xylulose-5-phosphate synthase
VLEQISSPADLRGLSTEELEILSGEIRDFLIQKVSRTGGHLGPNLGVVELTLAIHIACESPRDVVIFDTGHQSYVHKLLTGRAGKFDALRTRGGIAGYPMRVESEHDVVENSHASTSISWGDGISRGFELLGEKDRWVVVVIGDGALTGGMSWEALNNISAAQSRNLIVILNDNARSYSPTVGGLATHLKDLRELIPSENSASSGGGIFSKLGLRYQGPCDGHDVALLTQMISDAKTIGGPVLLHVVTEKGRGYQPALDDDAEKFHAVGVIDPDSGLPIKDVGNTWTKIFGSEMVAIGEERCDVVAITAAMLGPTGLVEFRNRFPDRTIDVGIAEQHAVTSAAGMAFAGLHPVIAVYSSFLNRAFDQLLLDVALHGAGVTFVLDRSGVTGDDGPSHNGMWDLALTGIVPTLKVAAPRDGAQLRELLRESLDINDRPTLLRFPKGETGADIPAVSRIGSIDLLRDSGREEVVIVGIGAFASLALEVAQLLEEKGTFASVVDARWVRPISEELITFLSNFELVVVLEDGIAHAGIASSISEILRKRNLDIPLASFGLPLEFLQHSKRNEVLKDCGLSPHDIAQEITLVQSNEKIALA